MNKKLLVAATILVVTTTACGYTPQMALASSAQIPVAKFTRPEATIMVGQFWTGICKGDPWMILFRGSGPNEIVTLEGNPDIETVRVDHKAGAFRSSSCFLVRTVYHKDFEYYTLRIYSAE